MSKKCDARAISLVVEYMLYGSGNEKHIKETKSMKKNKGQHSFFNSTYNCY